MSDEILKENIFLKEVSNKRSLKISLLHFLTHIFTKFFPKRSYQLLLKFLSNPNSRRDYELRTKVKPEEFKVKTKLGDVLLYKFGSGSKSIFLIHGWADSTRRFTNLIDFLTKDSDVCIWSLDHIGHGKSDGNVAHIFGFIDGVNSCLSFMKNKGYQVNTFISHSMGGLALLNLDQEQIKESKKIIISSPSKFFEFMFKRVTSLGVSVSTIENLLNTLSKQYNKDWKTLSPDMNTNKIDHSFIFIHDKDDEVCSLSNLKIMLKNIDVKVHETSEHGHLKILKKESVFNLILGFIKN